MIKKTVYPKTKRISNPDPRIYVTEKLDGSNLCIFKKDGEIYFAQRNNICTPEEVTYKGLTEWAINNVEWFKENLHERAVICGEWLGMGKLKYDFPNKFFMFAKANIDENLELRNIIYNHELFIYPFINQEIPEFISVVPEVCVFPCLPQIEDLNSEYERYRANVGRDVEGFVINNHNMITKYVRMKNGKLEEHRT